MSGAWIYGDLLEKYQVTKMVTDSGFNLKNWFLIIFGFSKDLDINVTDYTYSMRSDEDLQKGTGPNQVCTPVSVYQNHSNFLYTSTMVHGLITGTFLVLDILELLFSCTH